jgi:hypothetical protein
LRGEDGKEIHDDGKDEKMKRRRDEKTESVMMVAMGNENEWKVRRMDLESLTSEYYNGSRVEK